MLDKIKQFANALNGLQEADCANQAAFTKWLDEWVTFVSTSPAAPALKPLVESNPDPDSDGDTGDTPASEPDQP